MPHMKAWRRDNMEGGDLTQPIRGRPGKCLPLVLTVSILLASLGYPFLPCGSLTSSSFTWSSVHFLLLVAYLGSWRSVPGSLLWPELRWPWILAAFCMWPTSGQWHPIQKSSLWFTTHLHGHHQWFYFLLLHRIQTPFAGRVCPPKLPVKPPCCLEIKNKTSLPLLGG